MTSSGQTCLLYLPGVLRTLRCCEGRGRLFFVLAECIQSACGAVRQGVRAHLFCAQHTRLIKAKDTQSLNQVCYSFSRFGCLPSSGLCSFPRFHATRPHTEHGDRRLQQRGHCMGTTQDAASRAAGALAQALDGRNMKQPQ